MTTDSALAPRRRAYSGQQRARMAAYFCGRVEPVRLLRAIVADGAATGRWRGSADFAQTYLVRDPRTVRRWMADRPQDRIDIPAAVVDRLVQLALDMGLPPDAVDAVE